MTTKPLYRRAFRTRTICGNEVRTEDTLIWYDGPLLETLRDTDGNLYLSYNPGDTVVVARLPLDILLKALRSEIPLRDAFRAGTKKYFLAPDRDTFCEVLIFNDDDLFDPDVRLRDTGARADEYVAFLGKQAKAEEPTKTPDVRLAKEILSKEIENLPFTMEDKIYPLSEVRSLPELYVVELHKGDKFRFPLPMSVGGDMNEQQWGVGIAKDDIAANKIQFGPPVIPAFMKQQEPRLGVKSRYDIVDSLVGKEP